jgi:hypothetical protein
MYTMAGGASLTNWARSILIQAPTNVPGTYRFIAGKRFEKIGWQEREQWFSHSIENGKPLWIPSSQAQQAAAKSGRSVTPDDVLALIPVIDPILQEKLWLLANQKLHVSERTVRNICNILLHDGKIYEHLFPRKGTRAAIGYAQTPSVI